MSVEGKGPIQPIPDQQNPNTSSDEIKNRLMKDLTSPETLDYIKAIVIKLSPGTQKADREDIVQETLAAMSRNIQNGNFDENRVKLTTYLYEVVHSKVTDLYREKKRKPVFQIDTRKIADPSPNPIEKWIKQAYVEGMFAQLEEKRKKVLELVLQGHDYKSIAKEMNITTGGVGSLISRAKEDLKEVIEEDKKKNKLLRKTYRLQQKNKL